MTQKFYCSSEKMLLLLFRQVLDLVVRLGLLYRIACHINALETYSKLNGNFFVTKLNVAEKE